MSTQPDDGFLVMMSCVSTATFVNLILITFMVVRCVIAIHRTTHECDKRAFVVPLFLGVAFVVLTIATKTYVTLRDPAGAALFFCWQMFHAVSILGVTLFVIKMEERYGRISSGCAHVLAGECMGVPVVDGAGKYIGNRRVRCRRKTAGLRGEDNAHDQG